MPFNNFDGFDNDFNKSKNKTNNQQQNNGFGNNWGSNPDQSRNNSSGGGFSNPAPVQNYNYGRADDNSWTVISINEQPIYNSSPIGNLFNGKPLFGKVQYNLRLQNSNGQTKNAVIYGHIEDFVISSGMRVTFDGKQKSRRFVIKHLYDADSGQEYYIDKNWYDPDDPRMQNGGRRGRPGGGGLFPIIAILVVLLAVGGLIMSVINSGSLSNIPWGTIELVAAIVAFLVFCYVFRINIFNQPWFQKAFLFIIAALAFFYVPGAGQLIVMLIGLYLMWTVFKGMFHM